MNIITHYETVLEYLINPNYFEVSRNKLSQSFSTQSGWRRGESKTFILTYNLSYSSIESGGGDQFLKYEGRLTLVCNELDLEQDCFKILDIKNAMNRSMESFLRGNTFSYFALLNFERVTLSSDLAEREKFLLKQLMETKSYENKTESEKKFEKYFDDNHLKIIVSKE